jgi:sec-independent protein translocase protein TatC
MSDPAAAPGEGEGAPGAAMSLLGHLEELRRRLVATAIGVAVAFSLAYWKVDAVMEWCQGPYHKVTNEPLSVFAVSEAFFVKVRVAFLASLFLAAPWIVVQVWGFISPALYPRERRMAVPFIVAVSACFLAGGAFGYYVGLPVMLSFLLGQSSKGFELDIRAESYVSTLTTTLVGMGLVFEAPVLAAILARLGLVTAKGLASKLRHAILGVTVLAAVITPSGDIPTLLVFAVPMLLLYVVSIGVAWFFGRPRR